ncbi:hypothetical protein [Lacticaseibacillus zhaodongensis]|uniref:hypothetical protein n=1 Tax=Lacticaseibacillus zhaodongensis TaxID=2668065 RepID=UPI0012D33879|nr:hypothetical protein [Lacticaseibacillus zhaodongensis]
MSNETKRDVFDAALDDWKQNFINSLPRDGSFEDWSESLSDYSARYAAALPDDLPVIPMAAGDEIEIAKMRGQSIVELLEPLYSTDTLKTSQSVTGVWTWAVDHSDTFARAWLDGVWRVEETGEIVKLEAEK